MKKIKYLWQEIRYYQWIKNLLIFAPLIFVKELLNSGFLLKTIIGFISFSLMASAVYVLNDIFDLANDKFHPQKKNRPLAAGKITLFEAKFLTVLLFIISLVFASTINDLFIFILFFYFLLNIFYSFSFKKIVILDLLFVALMYLIRVYAGATIINVPISGWLLLTTLFVALFIAIAKRRREIITNQEQGNSTRDVLKEYDTQFLDYLLIITNIATIIFYALYTMTHQSLFVWSIFFVIYAMFRYLWLVLKKGDGEEPEKIFVKDKPILFSIFGWIIFVVLVLYL